MSNVGNFINKHLQFDTAASRKLQKELLCTPHISTVCDDPNGKKKEGKSRFMYQGLIMSCFIIKMTFHAKQIKRYNRSLTVILLMQAVIY